jgi:uncharacterized Fe-S cluster protein YjdI
VQIRIDPAICIHAGQCYYQFPKRVKRGDEDEPIVIQPEVLNGEREEVEPLLDACPTGAIELIESGSS